MVDRAGKHNKDTARMNAVITPLGRKIAELVRATGPMSLADYMNYCLSDPDHGYYANRRAIGAHGDFITAPEVSQMYGELIGIWCAAVWHALGSPPKFVLAEAGPGKGTLMADLLRAATSVPGFVEAVTVNMIETSPIMMAEQRKAIGHSLETSWIASLEELSEGPLIVVANEFLDALPFRQFIKTEKGWCERCIALNEKDALHWVAANLLPDLSLLPQEAEAQQKGAVFEYAPAREAWIQRLSEQIAHEGGAALLIDYGHAKSGFGDTFQAVRGHIHTDPLAEPGLADLTSHVDFEAICKAAHKEGVSVSPLTTQGEFLLAMGLAERADQLGAGKTEAEQDQIRKEAERLALPSDMGTLFKVLALGSNPLPAALSALPPFAAPPQTGNGGGD